MRILLVIVIALFVSLSCSNARTRVNARIHDYKEKLNHRIDIAKKEDIALKYGIPHRKTSIGNREIWYYHFSYSDKESTFTPGDYNLHLSDKGNEQYDDLTLEFDTSGYLKSWRVYVHRQ